MALEDSTLTTAIGGYFEFELAQGSGEYHRGALRYQSARSALLALLREGKPSAIWIPRYACRTITDAAIAAGVPVRRYEIDQQFKVYNAQPAEDHWLLYVNYFGLCSQSVLDTLRRFNPDKVVIDNSQAFFRKPAECLATIYSPRKFFGVPDGGYLFTRLSMSEPDEIDEGSVDRCRHLLMRLGGAVEEGYLEYLAAETTLLAMEPRRMSDLTQALLSRISYDEISERRRKNFLWMQRMVPDSNRLHLLMQEDDVPLCYPLLSNNTFSVHRLHAMRIYVPKYWPEVLECAEASAFERQLAEKTLFLPCDQRMTEIQLRRVIDAVSTIVVSRSTVASRSSTQRSGR